MDNLPPTPRKKRLSFWIQKPYNNNKTVSTRNKQTKKSHTMYIKTRQKKILDNIHHSDTNVKKTRVGILISGNIDSKAKRKIP